MRDPYQRQSDAEQYAHRAITAWLPLLYLLISSLFFLRTYDSAQVKITVMQMGGLGLLTMWLCRLALAGRHALNKDDLLALAPFLASLLYGIFSFWQAPYHMASVDFFLRHMFYMSVALIVIYEFEDAAVQKLFRVLTWTAWIAIGYGALQWVDNRFFPRGIGKGIDPFVWRGAFGDRVFSTYGNPNFYGDFLVIMFPILLMQWLKKREGHLLALLALLLLNLISTGTKGAWLGFAMVCAVFAVIVMVFFKDTLDRHPPRKGFVDAGLALFGAGCVVAAIQGWSQGDKLRAGAAAAGAALAASAWIFHVLRTYTRLIVAVAAAGVLGFVGYTARDLSARTVSINFRLFTWEATWEMIQTQPWTGTGIGSFPPIYPAFRRPPIFHIEGKHNTETDHAENEYIERLFDDGIIGFGLFVWLVVSALTVGFRSLSQLTQPDMLKDGRPPPRAYDLIGVLVSFIGMLGHNNFDVSLRFVSSGVYLGLLSGLIVNVARGRALYELHPREHAEDAGPSAWSSALELLVWPARLAAIGGIIYFAFVIKDASQGMVPVAGTNFGGRGFFGQFELLQGPLGRALSGGDQFQWWIAWGTFSACMLGLGWVMIRLCLLSDNPIVPVLVVAMLPPLNLFWGYFKADIHHNIAIYFSKERRWDAAVANYIIVNRLNPDFVMAKYFLGNVFNDRFDMTPRNVPQWGDEPRGAAMDDYERALYWYNEVRRLAPNYVQMHHQVGNLHLRRAQWAADQGRHDEAAKYLDLALNRFKLYRAVDPVFPPNYFRMAQVHMIKAQTAKDAETKRKNFEAAADFYQQHIDAEKCAVKPSLLAKDWMRKSILSYQVYGQENGQWTHKHVGPPWPKESAEAYTNLANALFMADRLDEAEKAYRLSLSYDPKAEIPAKNLQVTYGKAKQLGRLKPEPTQGATVVPGVPVPTGWTVLPPSGKR